eukprot:5768329-Ditylum_brightwellii.AAC.1
MLGGSDARARAADLVRGECRAAGAPKTDEAGDRRSAAPASIGGPRQHTVNVRATCRRRRV